MKLFQSKKEHPSQTPSLTEEERQKIAQEEKLRAEIRDKEEKRKQSRKAVGCLIPILMIVAIFVLPGMMFDSKENKQAKNATQIYERLIMDSATSVIEKIPTYARNQRKVCSYKDGFLIEDIYNAEWYVVGSRIFAVNGLAKSLTPDIEYAPIEISYQPCY